MKRIKMGHRWLFVWRHIKPVHRHIVVAVLLSIVAATTASVGLGSLAPLVATALPPEGDPTEGKGRLVTFIFHSAQRLFPLGEPLLSMLLFMALFVSFSAVAMTFAEKTRWGIVYRMRDHWRERLFKRFLEVSYGAHLKKAHGEAYQNIMDAPEHASGTLGMLVGLLTNAAIVVALVVTLFVLSFWFALFSLGSFLLYSFIVLLPNRYLKKSGERRILRNQQLSGLCGETLTGFLQVKLLGLEEKRAKRFGTLTRDEGAILAVVQVMSRISVYLKDPIFLGLFAAGLFGLRAGGFDIGNFIPTLGAAALLAFRSVYYLSMVVHDRLTFTSLIPSLKLVLNFLEEAGEQEDPPGQGVPFPGLRSEIAYRKVCFAYEGKEEIIRDLTLTIPRGTIVAITGPSGCGKTTLVNMLARIVAPTGGEILIDGRKIEDYSLRTLRSKIGYVDQESFLFRATIRENLLLGSPEATEEEIQESLVIAHCREFVDALPSGLDTHLGEGGANLSGGQRQRLCIARAVLRHPDIYLFDEATSALDADSERYIKESITKIRERGTVILISHRPSTVEGADLVYALK